MMKTVTVTLPIEEALDLVRLARGESRCLIENGDATPDIDVLKRAQRVLSARERIMTALDEVAGLESIPAKLPAGMDLSQPSMRRMVPDVQADAAVKQATTIAEEHHGHGSWQVFKDIQDEHYATLHTPEVEADDTDERDEMERFAELHR